jgi:transcription antitermination factor NusG
MSSLFQHSVPFEAVAGALFEPHWYALYTSARHEKQVADVLERKQFEVFLPLYESLRRWKDRRVLLELPLFPGYLFVRIALRDRLEILKVPGTVRFVAFSGKPVPLADRELEVLRLGLSKGGCAIPHPYLRVGRRVRVKNGPFAGLEGILLRKKDRYRVVLSLELIMRSVSVEVDATDVDPLQKINSFSPHHDGA